MPQTTRELRLKMEARFGPDSYEYGPTNYLEAAGYTLTEKWGWEPKPGVLAAAQMTEDELDCMVYLIEEWDFDGLRPARASLGRGPCE